jgi:nucleoside-diphosphate-sugar epimerase
VATTHGLQQRDFIYAPDAADLLIRLLLSQQQGVFNIGTGRATTVRSVVEYLASRCGRPDLPQFGAMPLAPSEPKLLVADMTKVRDHLSWVPQTELHDGLDRVLAAA